MVEFTKLPWDSILRCEDCHAYFCPNQEPCDPLWFLAPYGLCAAALLALFLRTRGSTLLRSPGTSVIALLALGGALVSMAPLGRYAGFGAGQLLYGIVIAIFGLTLRYRFSQPRETLIKSPRLTLLLTTTFCVFFFLACATSLLVFGGKPLYADTQAILAQAHLFAQGLIKGTAAQSYAPMGFIVRHNNEWFSIYSPGHPALLALGVLAGNLDWMVNPLLGAASVTLMTAIAAKRYGFLTSLFTALLATSSPWIILLSAEYLNHGSTFFFFSLALFGITTWVTARDGRSATVVALGCFGMLITRPYTGLALSLPFLVFLLFERARRAHIAIISAGIGLGFVVLLAHNYVLSGSPFTSAYDLYFGPGHNPGFGDRGGTRGYHDIWRGLSHLFSNLRSISAWLYMWPVPSLALFVLAVIKGRLERLEALFLGCILSLCIFHLAYWGFGPELLGPRYIFETVGIISLFSASALASLWNGAPTTTSRGVIIVLLMGCVSFGWWLAYSSLLPQFLVN